ncbi:flagellar basal body P-ring formation chaperone FlgA [Octadecabacter sp. 1_MG-2023]|uniref:flagellar basal body P-ring formation chaperone FlgA n=1 Tax=unclassified Octadecabacter TaxID=196158 RepID=UPI001C0A210C|nr:MULTISPECIES: flagellar basal body P-ring formation chaperone FlgA [unclassified Octadecabacter]MBU2992384.1 flagellar basal body P-ring formation protein FlgA [Octadecabacter sp. B2R22]MDO6734859.1 flagellar basal body P-ring formation chaperone FlgA [Octadecabacter sp. 1_MG-2023]
MKLLALVCVVLTGPASADTVVATRTLPARTIIGPEDIALRDSNVVGGLDQPELAIGQESRVALYAGRPIRLGDIGPPAVIERNQIVMLVYRRNGISISTEGRALDRASPGDLIRVMNLSSRATVSAVIDHSGTAFVAQ